MTIALLKLLTAIPGIGDKTVHKYKNLIPASQRSKIKTSRQLRSALLHLPKDKFNQLPIASQTELLYKPIHRIPRDLISTIDNELHRIQPNVRFDIAGSYRRGKPYSGDLDIVMCGTSSISGRRVWDAFMQAVNAHSRVLQIMPPFAGREDKITVLLHVSGTPTLPKWRYVKVDVFLTSPDEYIFALLFATGSGKFNIRMRSVAKLKGYLLNQRGLYKKSSAGEESGILEPVPIKNERELFALLGIQYREPHDRES